MHANTACIYESPTRSTLSSKNHCQMQLVMATLMVTQLFEETIPQQRQIDNCDLIANQGQSIDVSLLHHGWLAFSMIKWRRIDENPAAMTVQSVLHSSCKDRG
ncbi:hypothetical protein MRB53_042329 [Persea americana]|nr:hypothetical protein MRB53_042329 [Persea americana]